MMSACYGFAWSDVTWCIVAWCTQNAPRRQHFHVVILLVKCDTETWNRTRPRTLQQNQHTRELISARKTFNSHMVCIALVEFMYHEFTRMPGESYHRRLRSLLFDCVTSFRALINSLFVDWACLLWTGFDLVAFAIDCVMFGTVVLHFGYKIHFSFIAKCQYIGASLPSVNTIH